MIQDIINTKNIIIAGVGGQGVIFAGRLLGNIAMSSGFQVKTSEIHGMSQQGGSVITHIRYGYQVFSPVIEKGQADLMIALEELEALRYSCYMKKDGIILLNNYQIKPVSIKQSNDEYPQDITKRLSDRCCVYQLKMPDLSEKSGRGKINNIMLLGMAVNYLGFSKEKGLKAIDEIVTKEIAVLDKKAFIQGYEMTGWESKLTLRNGDSVKNP